MYIGETTRRLEQRISEHQDACRKGEEKKSAVAEHRGVEGAPPDSMAGDECDRQSQQVWRIEGEGGTAYPSNTRGSALQPGCGFHSQDFVREATPTTISLIGKGFFSFFP